MALSTHWRQIRSSNRPAELVAIQRGIARLFAATGYDVQWQMNMGAPGVTTTTDKTVHLDYGIIADADAPIPDALTDILAGVALHEMGHVKGVCPHLDLARLPRDAGPAANVLEDIAIESAAGRYARSPAYRQYVAAARARIDPPDVVQRVVDARWADPTPIDRQTASRLLVAFTLSGATVPPTERPESPAIASLVNYAADAPNYWPTRAAASWSARQRATGSVLQLLQLLDAFGPPDDGAGGDAESGDAGSDDNAGDMGDMGDAASGGARAGAGDDSLPDFGCQHATGAHMPEALAAAVESYQDKSLQEARAAANRIASVSTGVAAEIQTAGAPAHASATTRRAIERALRARWEPVATKIGHVESGRFDRRAVSRVRFDRALFKQRETEQEQGATLAILLDCSSSTARSQHTIIMPTGQAIIDAVGRRIDLDVHVYQYASAPIAHVYGGALRVGRWSAPHSLGGGTCTGRAMLAAWRHVRPRFAARLMLVVTDGQTSDWQLQQDTIRAMRFDRWKIAAMAVHVDDAALVFRPFDAVIRVPSYADMPAALARIVGAVGR